MIMGMGVCKKAGLLLAASFSWFDADFEWLRRILFSPLLSPSCQLCQPGSLRGRIGGGASRELVDCEGYSTLYKAEGLHERRLMATMAINPRSINGAVPLKREVPGSQCRCASDTAVSNARHSGTTCPISRRAVRVSSGRSIRSHRDRSSP